MAELGLYGIARVYWSVFGAAIGHRTAISHVFLVLGVLTAVTGALYCFRERHIKRLLAFSTISHSGMFLAGFALLTPLGLAGAALAVAGHAFVKGALFLGAGIITGAVLRVAFGTFYGLGDPPGEDPQMAAEANEETGETESGRQRTPLPCSSRSASW